jgi:quinol monooxygenase YgiN
MSDALSRRAWLRRVSWLAPAAAGLIGAKLAARAMGDQPMYGLIGKFTAADGKRDELIAILVESTGAMPGCKSYVVAKDTTDPNGIWITEVWDSKESHDASLSLPAVRAAIARGRPLIAGMSDGVVTTPMGGVGL